MEKEIVINGIKYVAVEELTGMPQCEKAAETATVKRITPSLDDYTTIKTYEDACEALGINPIERVASYDKDGEVEVERSVIAFMKLATIAWALRGGKKVDFTEKDCWYYPWFYIYSEEYIQDMTQEEKQNVNLIKIDSSRCVAHGGNANYGAAAGVGYVYAYDAFSHAGRHYGSRLCFLQRDEGIAQYFGKQFIELWAEYNGLDVIKEK